jgi:DUF1680 family protein
MFNRINKLFMKKSIISILLAFAAMNCFSQSIVAPLEENKIDLFSLENIRLGNSEVKSLQDKDMEYLLTLEPDKLLSWFRREAGLVSKSTPYLSWESEGETPLSGHILGFYLSSMSMMYQTTKNPQILDRLRYVIQEMKLCQDAQGDGYLSAQAGAKQALLDVANNKGFVNGWLIGNTFEPTYVMNKLMLGLYGVYNDCGITNAKEILIKLADWIGYNLMDRLDHQGIQKLLVCEHGSLNESFVDVYTLTNDCKYLTWAKMLNHEEMLIPLAQGKDILDGWHANCQIQKFVGFLRVYRYDKVDDFFNASDFFWNAIIDNRTWVTGGNSTDEHFFNINDFGKKIGNRGGPESCNSVNMMRLTEALYEIKGEMKQVDYYEKVLYNHILANYKPDDAQCVYYTSMRPGHYKIHGEPFHSFYCCAGTGLEAPAKFGKMIYAHKNDTLFVNMFLPSSVNWTGKGITLTQQTNFPDSDESLFTVQSSQNTPFKLSIRLPYWAISPQFKILVNGVEQSIVTDNKGYVTINRTWNNNDRIEVKYPARLIVEPLKNNNQYVSVQYGPFVLGTEVDNHGLPASAFHDMYKTVADIVISEFEAPAMIGDLGQISNNIIRKASSQLLFSYNSPTGEVDLKPYYRVHTHRYALYFPRFDTNTAYTTAKNDYDSENEDRQRRLTQLTIDSVVIADNASETSHAMNAVNSGVGQTFGLWWRHALGGGFFEYRMKVNASENQSVYLVFNASDSGNRTFDVLIDGHWLQTINHNNAVSSATVLYPYIILLPSSFTAGKNTVMVRLQGKVGNIAGGIFDLRILNTQNMQEVPNMYEYFR